MIKENDNNTKRRKQCNKNNRNHLFEQKDKKTIKMAKRKIVKIDEKKCNGCGVCIPNCHEGALQIIDKKARLISDLFCDGLGACIGHCPKGAITIVEREAKPYDEVKTMQENIVPKGKNTIKAHLEHLKEHNETKYLNEAIGYLKSKKITIPKLDNQKGEKSSCPGSQTQSFSTPGKKEFQQGKRIPQLTCQKSLKNKNQAISEHAQKRPTFLTHWPVQLHLIHPSSPQYIGKDVLIAADCVAYSYADFHKDYLAGKSLAIACPKLDSDQEVYVDKIRSMIDDAKIKSLTVIIMEVPCCGGLLYKTIEARDSSKRKIPIQTITIGIKGNVLSQSRV